MLFGGMLLFVHAVIYYIIKYVCHFEGAVKLLADLSVIDMVVAFVLSIIIVQHKLKKLFDKKTAIPVMFMAISHADIIPILYFQPSSCII